MSAKGDKKAVLVSGTGPTKMVGQLYYAVVIHLIHPHFFGLPGLGFLHPRVTQRKFREQVETLLAYIEQWLGFGHSQAALKIIELSVRAILSGKHKRVIAVSLAGPLDGAPLAKLASGIARFGPLHFLLGGITEMIEGSKQLNRLHAMLQDLVDKAAKDPDVELPYLVLIAAAHDHLVPLASAWRCIEDYPEDRIFRILLLGGNGPPPKNLPDGVIIVRTQRGLDDHIMMIFSPALLRLLVKIHDLDIDASLEEALRSAA